MKYTERHEYINIIIVIIIIIITILVLILAYWQADVNVILLV